VPFSSIDGRIEMPRRPRRGPIEAVLTAWDAIGELDDALPGADVRAMGRAFLHTRGRELPVAHPGETEGGDAARLVTCFVLPSSSRRQRPGRSRRSGPATALHGRSLVEEMCRLLMRANDVGSRRRHRQIGNRAIGDQSYSAELRRQLLAIAYGEASLASTCAECPLLSASRASPEYLDLRAKHREHPGTGLDQLHAAVSAPQSGMRKSA
jgi:hypothetical protein